MATRTFASGHTCSSFTEFVCVLIESQGGMEGQIPVTVSWPPAQTSSRPVPLTHFSLCCSWHLGGTWKTIPPAGPGQASLADHSTVSRLAQGWPPGVDVQSTLNLFAPPGPWSCEYRQNACADRARASAPPHASVWAACRCGVRAGLAKLGQQPRARAVPFQRSRRFLSARTGVQRRRAPASQERARQRGRCSLCKSMRLRNRRSVCKSTRGSGERLSLKGKGIPDISLPVLSLPFKNNTFISLKDKHT